MRPALPRGRRWDSRPAHHPKHQEEMREYCSNEGDWRFIKETKNTSKTREVLNAFWRQLFRLLGSSPPPPAADQSPRGCGSAGGAPALSSSGPREGLGALRGGEGGARRARARGRQGAPSPSPSSRGSGKSPRGVEAGWSPSTQDPHPQGVPGSAGPPSWRQPDSPLRGVPSGRSPQLLRPRSQSPRAPRPCLNSSPRVLSSNFQPFPLGITGPTQLEAAFSLTPGLPRNTPRRHMTKLLPTPCRPSPPPQTTSRGRGGPTGRTLALQGLMAPALLFLREKPTPLLFLPATLGREDGQMQRQLPPGSSPCPLRTLTFSHGAVSHLLNQGQEAGESRQV